MPTISREREVETSPRVSLPQQASHVATNPAVRRAALRTRSGAQLSSRRTSPESTKLPNLPHGPSRRNDSAGQAMAECIACLFMNPDGCSSISRGRPLLVVTGQLLTHHPSSTPASPIAHRPSPQLGHHPSPQTLVEDHARALRQPCSPEHPSAEHLAHQLAEHLAHTPLASNL